MPRRILQPGKLPVGECLPSGRGFTELYNIESERVKRLLWNPRKPNQGSYDAEKERDQP